MKLDSQLFTNSLPPGTYLQAGRYIIDSVLDYSYLDQSVCIDGGCFIYLARDNSQGGTQVVIREYVDGCLLNLRRCPDGIRFNIPSGFIHKHSDNQRGKFVKTARRLSRLRHPNWISIIDFFEENETTYYVSDYLKTISLTSYIKQHEKFSEQELLTIARDVASALRQIHSMGLFHLSVLPDNIQIGNSGRAYLTGFGVWRIDDGEDCIPTENSHFFSPESIWGSIPTPVSEIYSLGAVLYNIVTRQIPPGIELLAEGFPYGKVSGSSNPHIAECIAKAMSLRARDRYQSFEEFMGDLGVPLPPFKPNSEDGLGVQYADINDMLKLPHNPSNDEKYTYALPVGTVLVGKNNSYEITKVLGQGGFGITYLANANVEVRGNLGIMNVTVKVCIKEFFMKDLNGRNQTFVTTGGQSELYDKYKRKFLEESTHLSELHHSGIVKVLEAFEGNNTYYYVMDYIEGTSLDEYIRQQNGLPIAEAVAILNEIGQALSHMHNNHMLHLDLKPMNVMRRTDGHVVLIDFGLSKLYDDRGNPETSTTIGAGTPGYAPLEQLNYNENSGSKAFPVTMDVYALTATFYKMLTGLSPQKAADILNDGLDRQSLTERGIPDDVISLIESGLSPTKRQRPQSVTEFLDKVNGLGLTVIPEAIVILKPNVQELAYVNPSNTTIIPQKENNNKPTDSVEQSFLVNGVSFKMIWVEGGTFTMGATSEQGSDADSDEKPTHQVTLSTFSIGETEVTQELWQAVMGNNPSKFKGPKRPVEQVSWEDCQAFIRELNRLTGRNFRLPTEAEWEYAARGGQKSNPTKYAGSSMIGDMAWYGENSGNQTHDVATKCANELGLYDMSGNVWEWCQDWFGSYSSGSQTNPKGASSGSYRVNRGGSWSYGARNCRVSYRNDYIPTNRFSDLGLRLAF